LRNLGLFVVPDFNLRINMKKVFVFFFLVLSPLIYSQGNEVLMYFSNQTGSYQLYKSDANGNNPTQLIDEPGYNFWWVYVNQQNTKFITYRSDIDTGIDQTDYENAELWLYNIDGTNPVLLIDTNTYNWKAHGVAKFSPDGEKILMAATPSPPSADWWFGFVTDNIGQSPQQISDWWMLDPAWSPDGSKIVFCGFPNNIPDFDLTKMELFIADFDHNTNTINTPVQITSGTGRVHDPCFSHQGERIVFSDGNESYTEADIRVVDTNGDNLFTVFSDRGANGGSIFWSFDDSEIWFHNLTLLVNNFQIRKVNVSTGSMTPILQSVNHHYISAQMINNQVSSIPDAGLETGLSIFPNPFSSQTTIKSDVILRNATLFMYNAEGKMVRRVPGISGRTIEIYREQLPNGLYLLRLTEGNETIATDKISLTN
jgi:Tol biopolymer transport system component